LGVAVVWKVVRRGITNTGTCRWFDSSRSGPTGTATGRDSAPCWIHRIGGPSPRSVQVLVELGLLEEFEGRYRTAHPTINVDRLPVAAKQRGRHDILRRGMESLLRHPAGERHTTCLLLAMSEESYRQATDVLTEAAQKCLGLAAADPRVDRVWQVAIQVFPASLPLQVRA
jgi:hypothetical protein